MLVAQLLPRVTAHAIGIGEEHHLELPLRMGRLVAVTGLVPNYESWRRRTSADLRSPHGDMRHGLHMVVLASRVDGGLGLFDPYYPGDAQPLVVDDDDFVGWFAGHAFIARP